MVLHGIDPWNGGEGANLPIMEILDLEREVIGLVAADFDGDPRDELALLDVDGYLRLLDLRAEPREARFGHLTSAPETTVNLTAARLSGQRHDDLVLVDSASGRAVLFASESLPGAPKAAGGWSPLGELTSAGGITTVVPARLDFDAFDDLLVIDASAAGPAVAIRKTLATFTVNQVSDTDDGSCTVAHCTLREAINAANANPATADTIQFTVGTTAILPTTSLPVITGPVVIDGAQGAPPNTTLTVVSGTSLASGNGLTLTSSNNTLSWLAIGRFPGRGVVLSDGGDNTVSHCYLGLRADGIGDHGNGTGVALIRSSGNTIGGTTADEMNWISGNSVYGVFLYQSSGNPSLTSGNLIVGNRIGTNRDGDAAVANGIGVSLQRVAGNTIGWAGGGNLIAGNVGDGIAVSGGSSKTTRSGRTASAPPRTAPAPSATVATACWSRVRRSTSVGAFVRRCATSCRATAATVFA